MFSDTAHETNEKYREKILPVREETLKELYTQYGMTYIVLTDEEKQAFRELSIPVRQQYVDSCGGKSQEILDAFTEYLKNYN